MAENPPANAGDPGSIPGLGRYPGERNGNPLQCSCQGNPMDSGTWWATVHGVARVKEMAERLINEAEGKVRSPEWTLTSQEDILIRRSRHRHTEEGPREDAGRRRRLPGREASGGSALPPPGSGVPASRTGDSQQQHCRPVTLGSSLQEEWTGRSGATGFGAIACWRSH